MKILCLDLGTISGYAYGDIAEGDIEHGSVSFKDTRFDGGGMRYLRFQLFVENLFKQHNFDAVFYEMVRNHKGCDAAHRYGGFLGVLQTLCECKKTPYSGVSVGSIKKELTGSGNASKLKMIETVIAYNYMAKDDNEADAIAIFLLKRKQFKEKGTV